LAVREPIQDSLTTRLPRNGILHNIGYLLGGQVATWILAATWTVVVPRHLGPDGMGRLVTVLSATGILLILVGLGTRVLVVTEIARHPASAGRQVASAIATRLILFVPGVALMAIFLHFAHFDQYQVVLLVVATASMPLVLANEVLQAAFQGLERMQYLAYLDVIYKTVITAGGIVLVLLGFHVLGLVLLGAVAGALVFATSLHWARRHFDLVWRTDIRDVRRMAIASLPFWATTVFLTVYTWIDSVMLAALATPTEVGWYGVSTKLFGTLFFIPLIIGTATLARLTATYKRGQDDFRRELSPIVGTTLVLSLPIAAGTMAVAKPLIALLYGPAFSESASVLGLLALALPATYLSIVVNQSLVASNRQIVWTKVMAAGAVVNPLLNLIAIPAAHAAWHDAALGAALSLIATELLMAVAGLYLVRTFIDPALIGRVARAALAAVTMGLCVHLAERYGLIVQVALGLAIFIGLTFPLRLLRPAEVDLARRYAARLARHLVELRLSTSTKESRLLLISGVSISRSRQELSPDEPVPDYIVIREELSPEVLDPTTIGRVRHPLVRAAGWVAGPLWAIALAALLTRRRYKGVIATGEDVGLRLAVLSRLTRAPIRMVMVCHNLTGRRSRLALGRLHAGREVTMFHCLTSSQARMLRDRYGVPADRIAVVHWHVDHRFFHPQSGADAQERRICSAGMASRDYATLLEAARDLDVELKIAADSPWFQQTLNVTPESAGPKVEIRSFRTHSALSDLYASSRFVVVPLLDVDRAAGISVILEAMAMGKAVIATRTMSPDDLIVDGRNGFHVKPGDSAELRERMRYLLDHPDEAERMGSEGRRMVEQHFTIEGYIDQLRKALDMALEKRPRRMNARRMATRAVRLYQLSHGPSRWPRVTVLLARALFQRRGELAIPVGDSVIVIGTGSDARLLSSGELGELIFLTREIYDQRVYEFVPDFAPAHGWTVIDAGANIGVFTVRAARLGARVIAFEPNSQLSRLLGETIVANKIETRVAVFDCALGAQPGFGVLDVGSGSLGAHLKTAKTSDAFPTVSIRRLDDVAAEIGLDHIDLLKVDVEGFEVEVLKGAAGILESVDRVVLEYHSHSLLAESTAFLEEFSFLPAGVDDLHPDLGYGHAFFKRAPSRQPVGITDRPPASSHQLAAKA
jgi:FkbM family methyltransferase